jgi:tetratricopeptide (TPR) repeat protein
MRDAEKILQTYIEHILKLQEEHRQVPLTVEELNLVASELGLTSSEIQFIDSKFKDYLFRGQGFIRYKNWDRAIEDLEKAVILKPLHLDVLFGLAEAYKNRWLEKGKKQDKQKALLYAERTLQSDARHEGALFMISQINRLKPRQRHGEAWKRLGLVAFVIAFLLFLTYVFLLTWNPFEQKKKIKEETVLPEIVEKPSEKSPKEKQIQVEILPIQEAEGFTVETEISLLQQQGNNWIYNLRLGLINTKYNVENLIVKLSLLDEGGKSMFETELDLVNDETAEMYQGDFLPVIQIIKMPQINQSLQKARLTVVSIERFPPDLDADLKLIDVKWEETAKKTDLKVHERYQVIEPEPDNFEHTLTWEFINQSKQDIQSLEVQVDWFDKENRLMHSEHLVWVENLSPIFKPQQKRAFKGTFLIPLKRSDYDRYEVSVVK